MVPVGIVGAVDQLDVLIVPVDADGVKISLSHVMSWWDVWGAR